MSGLQEYLVQKRIAVLARKERTGDADAKPHTLSATVRAEDRSGVRRIRIRDFQVLSDSGPDFAGYNLGPASPELQLGVLGSCLTHVFLIQAAELEVPLDSIEVEITGQIDPRGGTPGFETVPIFPHNITYAVKLSSTADAATLDRLHQAVEERCPILNLLKNPQVITGTVENTAA